MLDSRRKQYKFADNRAVVNKNKKLPLHIILFAIYLKNRYRAISVTRGDRHALLLPTPISSVAFYDNPIDYSR